MDKLKISSLSPQPLVLIMAIITLIAVPLRTFQLFNNIDPETGFWTVRDFTVPSLYALCVFVVVLSLGVSFFSGIMPKPEFSKKRSIPLCITSVAFAIAFLADAITQMSVYISLFSNYVAGSGTPFGIYLISSGALALTLQSIFGILSGFYVLLVAFSSFLGNTNYGKAKILALMPVLWGICRMVYHFVNPISYKNVSQLLLELATLTFMMVFFLSFARIASHVGEESSMWILWFSGVSGAFFAYVSTLSPVVLLITGNGNLIPDNYPIQYVDLVFAFFSTIVLFLNLPRTIKTHT